MTHQFDNVGSEGTTAPSHTPGPWHALPYQYVLGAPTRARIHGANHAPVVDDCNPSLADARLIAAAPDLLAALNDIVSCCDANDGDSLANAVNAARAAIARAKGE